MKKIFIAIAAVAAMTLASCGGQTAQGGENDTIDTVVVEESNVEEAQAEAEAIISELAADEDATTLAEKAAKAKAYIEQLIKNGDVEAAKAYASKIKQFVEENKAKFDNLKDGTTTITELINGVTTLPTNIKETAEAAAEAVNADANAAKEAVKAAAEAKANEVVEETKAAAEAKANEAVDKAASKANEAINKAAEDAKKKLGF